MHSQLYRSAASASKMLRILRYASTGAGSSWKVALCFCNQRVQNDGSLQVHTLDCQNAARLRSDSSWMLCECWGGSCEILTALCSIALSA
jgi:hypothetical protein